MKLRCAGAVSGAFDVGDAATVGELMDALAKRVGVPGEDLRVFAGGRSLPADASTTLDSLGVSEKTRLVVSRVRRDPAIEAQARRAAQQRCKRRAVRQRGAWEPGSPDSARPSHRHAGGAEVGGGGGGA